MTSQTLSRPRAIPPPPPPTPSSPRPVGILRRVERASRHVKLLSETIATVTSSLDLDAVTAGVARGVARALHADACFVYTYDDAAKELVLQAVHGTRIDTSAPRPRMRLDEGLTGFAAAQRAAVAIAADADHDPRSKRFAGLDEQRFASFLAVPILDRREHLAGAINVRTADRRDWQPDEVELLSTIARQVAQALENAASYERAQRRVAELEALTRIAEAVSQSLYQEEALARISSTILQAVHADCCALVLAGADGARVAQRAGLDHPDDAALLTAAATAPVDAARLVALPLLYKTRHLGAVVVHRSGGRRFSREDRALLVVIAHQAAIAVESSRGVMRSLVAQEIHHRVKNNLQTVASLLRLGAAAGDPTRALEDCVDRVLSIAEVHDLLTASREGAVDAADLIRRVTGMLGHGLGVDTADQRLEPVTVPGAAATAIALIFCELYTNALRHGGGRVDVALRRDGGDAALEVRDHGPGLDRARVMPGSLGLRIARGLARDDLAGTLRLRSARPGTRATLRFPVAARE